ncbi:MAG: hypothetical protein IPL46_13890 [Saprospiraceae bacterium]|nr:hypothetical protein [Saprospiraceae bacterium]
MRLNKKIDKRVPVALLTCLGIVLMVACQKEEVVTASVNADLQQYFDRFAAEGKSRGIIVDFHTTMVAGILSNTLAPEISGQCQHDSNNPDRLIINQTYWLRSNAMEREFLVFHELGHCYLQRPHLDNKDSRGVCMSMMHSGASACRNEYDTQTRSAYLDELFNPN